MLKQCFLFVGNFSKSIVNGFVIENIDKYIFLDELKTKCLGLYLDNFFFIKFAITSVKKINFISLSYISYQFLVKRKVLK